MESTGTGREKMRNTSGRRICIVGTGGQGVLTAARLLCDAFVEGGHDVVSGQLHGMAQRGGAVQATVMVDSGISPMIGEGRADVVLGLEPVETVRALPLMSSRTVVLMNTAPVIPFTLGQQAVLRDEEVGYPDIAGLESAIRQVTERILTLDATQEATETGSARSLNMLMLGCLLGTGVLPCAPEEFWKIVGQRLPPSMADVNARAYNRGVVMVKNFEQAGLAGQLAGDRKATLPS
jgi:indolepyruvate ferredoxin oxidoreductase beta subunit